MSDIQPHPSLPPVSLQGGERGVAALLLPTTCSPRPGVTVYVLQISNMTSQQVRHGKLVISSGTGTVPVEQISIFRFDYLHCVTLNTLIDIAANT